MYNESLASVVRCALDRRFSFFSGDMIHMGGARNSASSAISWKLSSARLKPYWSATTSYAQAASFVVAKVLSHSSPPPPLSQEISAVKWSDSRRQTSWYGMVRAVGHRDVSGWHRNIFRATELGGGAAGESADGSAAADESGTPCPDWTDRVMGTMDLAMGQPYLGLTGWRLLQETRDAARGRRKTGQISVAGRRGGSWRLARWWRRPSVGNFSWWLGVCVTGF